MTKHIVKEAGKNGTVEVEGGVVTRTIKRSLRKDDVLSIPVRAVTSVKHDRRALGSDIVSVTTSGGSVYIWKSKTAPILAEEVLTAMVQA